MRKFDDPLLRFEKMVKEKNIFFFDAYEFENIISHYLDCGNHFLAKKALKLSLGQHPSNTNLALFEVELMVIEERFNKALDLVNNILNIETKNHDALFLKANIFSKQKKYHQSIKLLKEIINYSEKNHDIFYQIGVEYLFLEKYHDAIHYFEKSLQFDVNDQSSLYNILFCYESLKNNLESINFLKEYISKNPYSEIAWLNLGKNYLKEKKN